MAETSLPCLKKRLGEARSPALSPESCAARLRVCFGVVTALDAAAVGANDACGTFAGSILMAIFENLINAKDEDYEATYRRAGRC